MAEMVDDSDIPLPIKQELMECSIATSISYGWLCSIFRRGAHSVLLAPSADNQQQGPMTVAVASDPFQGIVQILFPEPVTWVGLPPSHIRKLMSMLDEAATAVEKKVM